MDGVKPAAYYSRGEGGAFYSALAAEEDADLLANPSLSATSTFSSSSVSPFVSSTPKTREVLRKSEVDEEDKELAKEVDARENERNRRVNPRGGSPGFP